ncbi:MAG: sigma-54-dependent Fis family transcriptional regulator [Deltaproteobacteria bacterium]|nr:MAG: sigma-54-dependent Fis family transcriptional regulator [Deltaproteobacteria bacterium]
MSCEVVCAASAPAALAALAESRFDLVLCERRMPFREGSPLAAELTRRLPDGRCAMTSDEPLEALAAEGIARGWSEVLARPAPAAAVLLALRRARERSRLRRRAALLEEDLARAASDRPIVAASRAMIALLEQVERVAGLRGALLITGESGSGREGIARAVHAQSPQRSGPFIAVDCARGSEREREQRLLGSARGHGPGPAIRDADGGTLYLDAIDALPVALQVGLAAALRDADAPGSPDRAALRAIAATSADLDELVRRGAFWKELYEPLRVARLRVPPLRERREDISLLVDHLLLRAATARGRTQLTITGDALDLLIAYRWPGNTRELAAVLEHAADLAPHDAITARELPDDLAHAPDAAETNPLALRRARRAFEADLIRRALRATAGNRTHAARLLEISHRALLYKLKELDIRD